MIKKFIKNYIIRNTFIVGLSLIGNYSQNPANDTINNKYQNSNQEINSKTYNKIEKIVKMDLLFYSERDKIKYGIEPNLNFYKLK